jgi:hypothetical protein
VRTPTINHAPAPFTENKRCRKKPRGIGDVVNPKAASVYQTDAVLILIGACKGADRALSMTKQYRVRRCSKECLLRSSPEHVV